LYDFESNDNLYKTLPLFLFLFLWKIKVIVDRRVKICSRKATYKSLQICKLQSEDVCSFDKEDEVFHTMEVVSTLELSSFKPFQSVHSSLHLFYFDNVD
jgi:hypothetical protein